jgi:hypothetical protein
MTADIMPRAGYTSGKTANVQTFNPRVGEIPYAKLKTYRLFQVVIFPQLQHNSPHPSSADLLLSPLSMFI